MRFEWDDGKNLINLKKHNINFETAAMVFSDKDRYEIYDEKHSEYEDRYITIGSIGEKVFLVTVVYTDRSEDEEEIVRIISARKATETERRMYYDQYSRY